MKTKFLIFLLFVSALPANQSTTVTLRVESLLDRAAVNRNLAEAFFFDPYAAGFFRGKAEAYEQLANSTPNP